MGGGGGESVKEVHHYARHVKSQNRLKTYWGRQKARKIRPVLLKHLADKPLKVSYVFISAGNTD